MQIYWQNAHGRNKGEWYVPLHERIPSHAAPYDDLIALLIALDTTCWLHVALDTRYLATVLEYNADELIHHLQYEDESCFWSPLAQFEWTMVNDAGATKSDAPAIIDTAQEDEQKPATRAGEVTVHVDKGHLSKKRKAANLKKPSATKSQKGEVSDLSATQGSIKEVKGLRDKGVCSSGVQSRQKKQAKKTKAR